MLSRLLLVCYVVIGTVKTLCFSDDLDKPIVHKDGDYIIAGLFRIGTLSERMESVNGSDISVTFCDRTSGNQYGLQKAMAFRKIVTEEALKYTGFNLGYAIYDTCDDMALVSKISMSIASNPKVVGVSGVDHKEQMVRSAGITTATQIPTFGYMYSDDDLLSKKLYPTMFSMIDTEKVEADVMISILKELGYRYMDIWYHNFSKEMADYIEKHVNEQEFGCGRIKMVTKTKIDKDGNTDLKNIDIAYNETGGKPSKVQLILSNSNSATREMLKYFLEKYKLTDTVYIFGMSNGRRSNYEDFVAIFKSHFNGTGSSKDSFIIPQSILLNMEKDKELSKRWEKSDDALDEIYKTVQENKCGKLNKETNQTEIECKVTSWLGYISAGTKVLVRALVDTLGKTPTTCDSMLQQQLYQTIIDPNRTMALSLGNKEKRNVSFVNKQFSVGYEVDVYDVAKDMVTTVGRAYTDRVEITHPEVIAQLTYPKTCSPVCSPGYRTVYYNVRTLPCCWECVRCDPNYFSITNNSDQCTPCNATQESTANNTDCRNVVSIYIKPDSYYFIGGASLVFIGFVLVIILAVYIFKREERPVIKASDPSFIYILLLSMELGICSSITPLLKPSVVTCRTEYFCFITFASLVASNLAWRCGKIYSVFEASNNFEKPKFAALLTPKGQTTLNLGILATNLVIAIICAVFGSWTFQRDQKGNHAPNYLTCNSGEGFPAYLIAAPAFISLGLFLFTLFLAFKMRKFPHNFRETTNIFMATLVVIMTCIMFLSGYTLSPPSIQPLLRAIVIYVSCLAFLACLFIPKIIILMNNVDFQQEKEELQAELRKFSSKTTPKLKLQSVVSKVAKSPPPV